MRKVLRTCICCNKELPSSRFSWDAKTHAHRPHCKTCGAIDKLMRGQAYASGERHHAKKTNPLFGVWK